MMAIPAIDMNKTGQNIIILRKAAGLSVRDLQDAFGFGTSQAIYKWQQGVALPSIDNLVVLAAILNVKVDDILEHHMHSEFYCIEQAEADKINRAKETGHRVICVGTTSCRTVESAADDNGRMRETSGWTEIFIYPGYQFKILDCLITNFHLPESTLIMLVSAFVGKDKTLNIYKEAVKEKYRFFSFGDSMFITNDIFKK